MLQIRGHIKQKQQLQQQQQQKDQTEKENNKNSALSPKKTGNNAGEKNTVKTDLRFIFSFFYRINWLTHMSWAEIIITVMWPFAKLKQIHKMTTIFTQKFSYPGPFWVEKRVICEFA